MSSVMVLSGRVAKEIQNRQPRRVSRSVAEGRNPEAVFRYADLLLAQKRFDDAIAVENNATKAEPANKPFRDLLNNLNNAKDN